MSAQGEQGDPPSHDFWLGGRWRILDITTTRVTVMNACGDEEILGIDTGFQPPPTTRVKMVTVADSQFGPGRGKRPSIRRRTWRG